MDSFRRQATCYAVRKLAGSAKQVIVLSHCVDFLKQVSETFDSAQIRTLKLEPCGGGNSEIIKVDLDVAAATVADKDIMKMIGYYHAEEKDALAVVRCIRPSLETYMQSRAPTECPPGKDWLGDYVGKVKTAEPGSQLELFKPIYDDLDFLNGYTKKYHHASGSAPAINETELRQAVEMTLKLLGRL